MYNKDNMFQSKKKKKPNHETDRFDIELLNSIKIFSLSGTRQCLEKCEYNLVRV